MAYLIHLAIFIAIYIILAVSLDLIVGYTGLLSVAHAAFYGIGAYATAVVLTHTGMDFFLATGIAVLFSMVIAFLIGMVLSRFGGDYYALGSLGFNFIVFDIMLNWQSVTRGPLGYPGIPRPSFLGMTFSSDTSFFVLALVLMGVVYGIARRIAHSSFGMALRAIREDERVAALLGYRTSRYKLAIFVIGAGMAAVAGALIATYITYIDPNGFTFVESIFILAIIILGGLANLRGAVAGTVFLILLPELLRFVGFPDQVAAELRYGIYGILLIFLMLYRPRGLMGTYTL